jgi:hypothetical protein
MVILKKEEVTGGWRKSHNEEMWGKLCLHILTVTVEEVK